MTEAEAKIATGAGSSSPGIHTSRTSTSDLIDVKPVVATESGAPAPLPHGDAPEADVWKATYSMWNFAGRLAWRVMFTLVATWVAIQAWYYDREEYEFFAYLGMILLTAFWLTIAVRMVQARYGHYYRLTNHRIFVSTGLMKRRRDQMELLRVKDVFIRQRLLDRWLKLGTVVVTSSEKETPTFYMTGVRDPHRVMDLVWEYARSERDRKTTKIDAV